MSIKKNVLIFPAGSEIGLEIYHSLKYSHHIEVFGVSAKNDHAAHIYNETNYIEGDYFIDQEGFIDRFNDLISRFRIEFIYPTHDTIAYFLAKNQYRINAIVITSCEETNRIARYKTNTYNEFRPFGFSPEVLPWPCPDLSFPVFLKPINGQGGKGAFIAEGPEDVEFYLSKDRDLLITEFLPGEELSVDCFTDYKGNLLFVGPRTRERVQMGISFRSTAVPVTDEINFIANTINKKVSLNGAWFFQVKKDGKGKFKLLEFAPRQSSTMGLYRHAGVNFALLSFFNAQKLPVQIQQNDYAIQLDRCLHNRYKSDLIFQRVYVDLDETLIAGTYVHEYAMAFLYQCRNKGINVVLLTKHRYDLSKTLENCGIATSLFEQIIHLSEKDEKWQFIEPEGAIFIDNYWFDRQSVKEKCAIPVFDADAIECLLC